MGAICSHEIAGLWNDFAKLALLFAFGRTGAEHPEPAGSFHHELTIEMKCPGRHQSAPNRDRKNLDRAPGTKPFSSVA